MNIFYWNLIVISFLALIISISPYNKKNKIFVIIVTLIMLGISGLRHQSVGMDLIVYYRQFIDISKMTSIAEVYSSQKNFGYALFNMGFIDVFGVNYQLFLFFIAVISIIPLGITIYRYSPAPYISFLLYMSLGFYDFTFSGLKQTLALAFVMLSYKYIVERKPFKFIAMVALGAMFHLSAFVFLPVYYIAHKKWSAKYAYTMIFTYLMLLAFRGQIVVLLADMYQETSIGFSESKFLGGKAIVIFMLLVIGLIMKKLSTPTIKDEKFVPLFNIILVSFAVQSLSIYSHNFSRLNFYYFQFVILYIPIIIENYVVNTYRLHIKRVDVKKIINVVLIILAIINYLNYINGEIAPHGILPYRTFWQ